MKEIQPKELKEICVKVLDKFDQICKENNFRYSIYYGTLIGAVRHQGFIPWDDDVDVIMPREDYEKLMAMQYDDGNYEIKNYSYTKDYFYPFAKMIDKNTLLIEKHRCEKNMGVYIDIFPCDYVDNYGNGFDKDISKALKGRMFINHLGGSTDREQSKNIFHYYLKIIAHKIMNPFKINLIKKFDTQFIKDNGDYGINFVNNFDGESQLIKTKYWDSLIPMKFENIEVMGFADYDAILSKKYGDYMQIPPESAQISHHGFVAYYK
jgi:lipopolysaccharide cholinephosphotransferase